VKGRRPPNSEIAVHRELFRGLLAGAWATGLLAAYDLARLPAGALPRHDAHAYLLGFVQFGIFHYAAFLGSAAILLSALLWMWNRFGPETYRVPGSTWGFHLGAAAGLVVLLTGLPVISERSGGPDSGIAPLLLEGQFLLLAGLATAGVFRWGINACLAQRRSGVKLALLMVLPCLPAMALLPAPMAEVISLSGSSSPTPPELGKNKPDIILIVADTMRADALGIADSTDESGAAGGTESSTPVLESLAAGGARFTQAISQATSSHASTASLLTGLMPSSHGMVDPDDEIRLTATLLAERLAGLGYRTVGIVANPGIARERGFDRGFHTWNQETDLRPQAIYRSSYATRILRTLGRFKHQATPRPASELVDEALALIRSDGEGPLFLYLHLNDPHAPYDPGKEVAQQIDPGYQGTFRFGPGEIQQIMRGEVAASEEDIRHAHALYRAEVSAMDSEIGRLLEGMDSRSGDEKPLVIFTANHGEEFLDHGALGHEHTLYQELVHVPLVMNQPGKISSGSIIDEPVSHLGLVPTILDLAGAVPARSLSGGSLAALIESGAKPSGTRAPILSEQSFIGTRSRTHRIRAARDGSIKVILSSPNAFGVGPWKRKVFDLSVDPTEQTNLIDLSPEAGELESILRRHITDIDGVNPGTAPAKKNPAVRDASEENSTKNNPANEHPPRMNDVKEATAEKDSAEENTARKDSAKKDGAPPEAVIKRGSPDRAAS
jgi:arylsulfatase A-like enzyme